MARDPRSGLPVQAAYMQLIRVLLLTALCAASFDRLAAQPPPAPVSHDRHDDITDIRRRDQIDSAFDHLDRLQAAQNLPDKARWKPAGDVGYRLDSLTRPTETLVAFDGVNHRTQFGFLSSDGKARDCRDGKKSSSRRRINADEGSIHLVESCIGHQLIWIPENREQQDKLDRLVRRKAQSIVVDGRRVSFDFSGTDLMLAALDVVRANQTK